MADLNTARQAYLDSQLPGTQSSDESFLSWWMQNIGNEDPSKYPADFEYLAALAESGNPQAVQVLNRGGYVDTLSEGITATSGKAPNITATPEKTLNLAAYLTARSDLANNFNNDPQYRERYGTLENYAKADFEANKQGNQTFSKEWYDQFYTAGTPAVLTAPNSPTPNISMDVGTQIPLEQGLLGRALPSLIGDVDRDAERRTIADQLAQQALAGTNAATGILGRTQGGGFDGAAYFAANPDVAAAYQNQANGVVQTPDQFAEAHYLNTGQREGRQPMYRQSAQLAQDFANADRTVAANTGEINQAIQTQLTALSDATTAMQQNLTGDLAQRAAALQQQIAALTQNLDQLDATQRKALTEQIAAMQANLEESVATQRIALQQQIQALQGAVGTQAEAQRAALTQELQALTTAQAPMAEARLRAAELQATAVNVGLERTKDQLVADAARSGFVGGSTVQNAALARATVDARQRAAEGVGAAQLANAVDFRDIGVRGATGERTIAEALAEAQRQITSQGATGEAALTTAGALGRQQIKDSGATGVAGITNQTGLSRAQLGAQGANTTFNDQVFGADQKRALADALAQGGYGLKSAGAQATLAAQQAGNAAKATYYDNDYARSLSAALAVPSLVSNTASTLTGLDNYAQSGLGRTQGLLNWWATNPSTAPTPGSVAVQPDTSGNAWANLGAGLVGTAGNIAAANNWWKNNTPTTTTTPSYKTTGSLPGYS